jgi:hypothetical protein
MSMEIHVLFRGKLPSKAALQKTMRELGFPFSIKPATGSLEQQKGFMPMLLEREETGVEFDVFDGRAAVEEIAEKDVDPRFDRVASFRWGGDMHECSAAVCGAAALAKLVNGAVLEEGEGKLMSVDEAIEMARQVFAALPKPTTPTPRPRRPNLKRVLKPLLDMRNDLVLVDRLLVIRPVRHILRGAFLRWVPKYSTLDVYQFVKPLFQDTGIEQHHVAFTVWSGYPDFQAMLLDGLAGDVFPIVGRIASLDNLLDAMITEHYRPEFLRVPMLLSGGNQEAEEYVTAWEKETDLPGRSSGDTHRWLEQEQKKGFAEYHEREAEAVRRFGIESIWEPSPFPAERSGIGPAPNSNDLLFALTPWPEYSTSWRHGPPDTPGDIQFMESWLRRRGKVYLLTPFTREEAERRHRNRLPYILATRLPGGPLLMLSTYAVGDAVRRSDGSIEETQPMPLRTYRIQIYGSLGRVLRSAFDEDPDQRGFLTMGNVDIHEHDGSGGHLWYSHVGLADGYKAIHDYRSGDKTYSQRPVTDMDRSTFLFPVPEFGEFRIFWNCISIYIENEGFGPFN